jgi:hypothetical protein
MDSRKNHISKVRLPYLREMSSSMVSQITENYKEQEYVSDLTYN